MRYRYSDIRIKAEKLKKCKHCNGSKYISVEEYEYVCNKCDGSGYTIVERRISIESLLNMLEKSKNDEKK